MIMLVLLMFGIVSIILFFVGVLFRIGAKLGGFILLFGVVCLGCCGRLLSLISFIALLFIIFISSIHMLSFHSPIFYSTFQLDSIFTSNFVHQLQHLYIFSTIFISHFSLYLNFILNLLSLTLIKIFYLNLLLLSLDSYQVKSMIVLSYFLLELENVSLMFSAIFVMGLSNMLLAVILGENLYICRLVILLLSCLDGQLIENYLDPMVHYPQSFPHIRFCPPLYIYS